jgi:Domain of unknown function (DUF4288)
MSGDGRVNADGKLWFSARTIYEHDKPGDGLFEERIVLIRAADFDEAFRHAEEEAKSYAEAVGGTYTGYASLYELAEEEIGDGAEVFSLMRDSDLPAEEYIEHFFATGNERQEEAEEEEGELDN